MARKKSCKAKTAAGKRCSVPALPGKERCRWHSRDPGERARVREQGRRGGLKKAYGALPAVGVLADSAGVVDLNLESAEGMRALLAKTMQALTRLPFDVRVATCIGQLATAQRAVVESSSVEQRLSALEVALEAAQQRQPLRAV
jgi:hypothetical protein